MTNALLALPRSMAPALVDPLRRGHGAHRRTRSRRSRCCNASVPSELLGRVSGLQDSLCTAGMVLGTIAAPAAVALDRARRLARGARHRARGRRARSRSRRCGPLDRTAAVRADELAPIVDVLAVAPDLRRRAARRARAHRRRASARRCTGRHRGRASRANRPTTSSWCAPATLDVVDSDGGDDATADRHQPAGPDDVFGEIGIVQRRPRTATVVATIECTLWRIPGDVFLDAVIGRGACPAPWRARSVRTSSARPAIADPGGALREPERVPEFDMSGGAGR